MASLRRRLLILVPLIATIGATCATYWYWTGTPAYAIRQIDKSLATHDVDTFHVYVDMDNVASRLIDDLVSFAQALQSARIEDEALHAVILHSLKPPLVELVIQQLERVIEDGLSLDAPPTQFAERPEHYLISTILNELGVARQQLRTPTDARVDGKIALVSVFFRNEELDRELTIEMKLRKVGHKWQVVELSNVQEVLAEIHNHYSTQFAAICSTFSRDIQSNKPQTDWYTPPAGLTRKRNFVGLQTLEQSTQTNSLVTPRLGVLEFEALSTVVDDSGKSWKQSRNMVMTFDYDHNAWAVRGLGRSDDLGGWKDVTRLPAYRPLIEAAQRACKVE